LKIQIEMDGITMTALLNDSVTADRIAEALPLEGKANIWGQEIYFSTPLEIELAEDAVAEVEVGTLAYWPTGNAVCIFFGPTPVSDNEMPRAYSPVNIFGEIDGDATVLTAVPDGAQVKITALA